MPQDSEQYRSKKRFFKHMLTIYGRNPVAEALDDPALELYKLHLADSNKPSRAIESLIQKAQSRGLEVSFHSKQALSRISKNAKQDQGVALDIRCPSFKTFDEFIEDLPECFEAIALDRITNPQNLGMIARSVTASPITALLLPEKGCAKLDSLAIKASAGTLFKTPIVQCEGLSESLARLKNQSCDVFVLETNSANSLSNFSAPERCVYVLGNESEGVSREIQALASNGLSIPMGNGVESLNVSIAAALLAFRGVLKGSPL